MDYLYQTSISFHKFFCIVFLLLNLVYLYLTQRAYSPKYTKHIRLFLPLFYTFMAFIFLTGMVVLPIFHFQMSLSVWIMILFFIYFCATGGIAYKKLKRQDIKKYKKFTAIIIIINIVVTLFFMVSKYI